MVETSIVDSIIYGASKLAYNYSSKAMADKWDKLSLLEFLFP